ncbi:MAG: hypothetical protein BAJALOKI1v1_2350001 [Promethearchaeota archaeon]|nr:MAG: hypothetical protein BAJALOKI1v1_2350001 [Candidatus Lokiarchaeota archaeon]
MPLNNEVSLKSALDDLFYKDTIKSKLFKIRKKDLYEVFPKVDGEGEKEYVERLCLWISERFGGYSIETIMGRFRLCDLKTYKEVSTILYNGKQYLIDETTAIVSFIFPIGKPIKRGEVDYSYGHIKYKQEKITKKLMN